jgi:hypothetical protein
MQSTPPQRQPTAIMANDTEGNHSAPLVGFTVRRGDPGTGVAGEPNPHQDLAAGPYRGEPLPRMLHGDSIRWPDQAS